MSGMELFHQIGTAIFALGSLVVAARLIWLSRKSGHWPELFLGLGIGCSVLGYGLMVVAMTVRGGDLTLPSSPLSATLTGVGTAVHHVGVTTSLLFVLSVFRQTETWARVLFAGMMGCLWVGFAGVALSSGFATEMVGHPLWLLEYSVVWVYSIWAAAECFRYHRMMQRRRALGLADPLIVNRFFLWGLASLFTASAIWIASTTFALMDQPARLAAWTPLIRVATAAVGLVTVACYGLTFFTPERYAQWLRNRSTPDEASA